MLDPNTIPTSRSRTPFETDTRCQTAVGLALICATAVVFAVGLSLYRAAQTLPVDADDPAMALGLEKVDQSMQGLDEVLQLDRRNLWFPESLLGDHPMKEGVLGSGSAGDNAASLP